MVTDDNAYIFHALKAQQWEKIKGEMRALTAMLGAIRSTVQDDAYKRFRGKAEAFIQEIEDESLYE